jgi:TonB family protein
MKYSLFLFVFFMPPIFCMGQEQIFIATEPMPSYPGGEKALIEFVKNHLEYPQSAINKGIDGQVIVQFNIAPNGDAVNIRIKQSLYPACDSAAITLVKAMPKWIQGNKGRISDEFTLPISFRLSEPNIVNGKKTYKDPEIMPSYPGGEAEIYKFIKSKRKYTKAARETGAEGKVICRFVVSADGSIKDINVIKGIHPDCDSIAANIISSMPKWIPGSSNGKPVPIYYTLPIYFPYDMKLGEKIYWAPDQLPTFQQGDQALSNFISENLKYPAQEACWQGKVVIRFIVTKEGKINSPEILKSVSPSLDKEALRVVSMMPDWIPAKHKGENVSAYYTLPVSFKLGY